MGTCRTAHSTGEAWRHAAKRWCSPRRVCQLLVDTLGFLVAWRVELANMSDRKGGRYLVSRLSPLWPRIKAVIADAGYESRELTKFIKDRADWTLKIVKRDTLEFAIVGLIWIAGRTFAWLERERRLSKDYEAKVQTSETIIEIAASRPCLKRLVRSATSHILQSGQASAFRWAFRQSDPGSAKCRMEHDKSHARAGLLHSAA